MADEQNKDSVLGGLRSRLPRFFAETEDETAAETSAPAASESHSAGAALSPVVPPNNGAKAEAGAKNAPNAKTTAGAKAATGARADAGAKSTPAPSSSVEEVHLQHLQFLVEEFGQVQGELQRVYSLVEEIAERESAQEKVFNTLHAELRDYKNDFIYEHLKPVVRPLLFLYDSLEQFDAEIALYERPSNGERRQVGLSPQLVRENIAFFRDQLIESLRICEVSPMETPKGAFNPKLHKVIDVVPVEADQDGVIQRVVRSGWFLNNQLLRSAEVIVGKKMA